MRKKPKAVKADPEAALLALKYEDRASAPFDSWSQGYRAGWHRGIIDAADTVRKFLAKGER